MKDPNREPHEGRLVMVHDIRGYTVGQTSHCSCGWESPELHTGEDGSDPRGRALLDHWAHLLTIATPEEAPA